MKKSTKGRKARKAGGREPKGKSPKEESAAEERKRDSSSCESGRDEAIVKAYEGRERKERSGRERAL